MGSITHHPTTNLKPVLDAIAEVKADVAELKQKVDRQGDVILDAITNLAVKVTRIENKVVDKAPVPDDAAEKLKRRRASQLRGSIAPPR